MTDVELIKSRLDIADIVGEYIQLKPAGASLKGLCPFHDEKTPSFMVHRGKQIFHCFGCQEGGDIFSFVQKQENADFPEALKILATKAGVQLKSFNPEQASLKTKLIDITTKAAQYFTHQLNSPVGQKARNYLVNQRKLSEETLKEFHIGFAPAGWDNLSKFLQSRKFHSKLITQSGLVINKDAGNFYDRFRERIMFPIADAHGQVVGFTGRLLPDKENDEKAGGKYINSPESPIFSKSNLLYGLSQAKMAIKQQGYVVFVEGQIDVVASHQAGVKNVVAASGTALTQDHFHLLKRLTEKIVFALDNDAAGLTALKRAVILAWTQELETLVVKLPSHAKDPADLVAVDPKAWVAALKQPVSFMDHFLDLVFTKYPSSSPADKKQAAKAILAVLKQMPDPIERAHYINIVSDRLQVDTHYINEALDKIKDQDQSYQPIKQDPPDQAQQEASTPPLEKYDLYLMALVTKFPSLLPELIKKLPIKSMSSQNFNAFYKEFEAWYNNSIKSDTGDDPSSSFEPSPEVSMTNSILELKAEQEFSHLTPAQAGTELTKILKARKKFSINQQLAHLASQLKKLEAAKRPKTELDQLLTQLHQLTIKLNQL
jgi:DNA primase